MWSHSTDENPYSSLPPPEEYGWCKDVTGTYVYDWECPEVIIKVTDTIKFLTKGCSCKKGCKTNQCGCRKNYNVCGPGCQCLGCTNVEPTNAQSSPQSAPENSPETDSESEESSGESLVSLETEIVTDCSQMCVVQEY